MSSAVVKMGGARWPLSRAAGSGPGSGVRGPGSRLRAPGSGLRLSTFFRFRFRAGSGSVLFRKNISISV